MEEGRYQEKTEDRRKEVAEPLLPNSCLLSWNAAFFRLSIESCGAAGAHRRPRGDSGENPLNSGKGWARTRADFEF